MHGTRRLISVSVGVGQSYSLACTFLSLDALLYDRALGNSKYGKDRAGVHLALAGRVQSEPESTSVLVGMNEAESRRDEPKGWRILSKINSGDEF